MIENMDIFLSYSILAVSLIGVIFILKWFSYKHILYLILWGGFLLAMIQWIYISFGKEFTLNFYILSWTFEVNNYIQDFKNSLSRWSLGIFALFLSLIIPAALEEFGKFYFFRKIATRLWILKSVTSCVFAIVYVAIGFAFFETAAYIYFLSTDTINNPQINIFGIAIVRVFISTLSHVLFSVIIWYYYGKAIFMSYEMIDNLEISGTTRILKKLKNFPFINIHTISRFYSIRYLLIGFSLSIILHTVYNYFMDTGNQLFAIYTILIGMILFISLINFRKHNKNYLDLKNKIAHLQEIKKIKGMIERKE